MREGQGGQKGCKEIIKRIEIRTCSDCDGSENWRGQEISQYDCGK